MDWNWLQKKTECALSIKIFNPVVWGIYPGRAEYNFFQSAMTVLEGEGAISRELLPEFRRLAGRAINGKILWDQLPLGKVPKGFKGYVHVLRELFKKLEELYKTGDKSSRAKIRDVLDTAKEVLKNRRKAVKDKGHLDNDIRVQHEHVIDLWDKAIKGLEKVMEACEGSASRRKDHQHDHEHGGSGSGIKRSSNRDTSESNQSKSSARPVSPVRRTCRDEYLAGPPGNSYAKSTADSLALNSNISHPEAYAICRDGVEFHFFKKAMTIIDSARLTSPPLLPAFLDLVYGSKDGIIIFWDRLPFKIRASCGPAGYEFVIRELFNTLGRIYKDGDPSVRSKIIVALVSAETVCVVRNFGVFLCRHQGDPRYQDLEDIVSLWEKEIERLKQVTQDFEGTAGRMDHRNVHKEEGSGSGTTSSRYLEIFRLNSPAPPNWGSKDECQGGRQEGSGSGTTSSRYLEIFRLNSPAPPNWESKDECKGGRQEGSGSGTTSSKYLEIFRLNSPAPPNWGSKDECQGGRQEGSGTGTTYRRGRPGDSRPKYRPFSPVPSDSSEDEYLVGRHGNSYSKYRPVSPVPSDSSEDEYQWRRPSHSYRKSTADKVEEVVDVGTRAVAAIGGVAAGGVGVGVVLNSIAATAGAGKSAPAITAFAASPVGQAIAVGTGALGAPAVLLASAAAAGGLLGFALRKK